MKLLLIEDDPIHREVLCALFRESFEPLEILAFSTEAEFLRSLPELRTSPPDIAVIDMMLPYCFPGDAEFEQPPPEMASEDAFHRAGARCWHAFQEHSETRRIPVIIHSVLREDRIRELFSTAPLNLHFLDKDSAAQSMLRLIRSLVPHHVPKRAKPPTILETILDATEASPGAFGFKINLKKLDRRKNNSPLA